MAKKIGVILSGCGVYDGSEIQEAVLTLLAIDKTGAQAVCMAPDIDQMHVVNHLTGEVAEGEKRNVLMEAARIVRGDIKDLAKSNADGIDALILPGGFGAAKNLCDFAVKGSDCEVNPEVTRVVREMLAAQKPVAAICIAPVILSKILGTDKVRHSLTIGTDKEIAATLETMGSFHVECTARDFVVDESLKLITSPAYMIGESITEVAEGIDKTVQALIKHIG